MALLFGLQQHTDETILHPGSKRFPAKKTIDGNRAALHFVALRRQILLGSAGIAADHTELEAERFFKQARHNVPATAHARSRAAWRCVALAQSVVCQYRRSGSEIEERSAARRRHSPRKFRPVEFDCFAPGTWCHGTRPANGTEREPRRIA